MRCSGWNDDSVSVPILLLWLLLGCREDAQQIINMGLHVANYHIQCDAGCTSDSHSNRWNFLWSM